MKRTTRNAAKTKQEIIEKSAPVFNVHGFAGTSMQMLVKATGYQMGGIYRHFDSKRDLAKAVFKYNYRSLVRQTIEIENDLSPKEKILAIIDKNKEMVINPSVIGGCPILNTVTEVDDTNDEFCQIAQSFVNEILTFLEGILEEGKATGTFQNTVEPKKDALFLYASFEGAILLGKLSKSIRPILDIFERLTQYLKKCVFVEN